MIFLCLQFIHIWEVGTIAIFLAWVDLIMKMRKLRIVGVYVVMFTTVFNSFTKLSILLCLALIAFATSFYLVSGLLIEAIEYLCLKCIFLLYCSCCTKLASCSKTFCSHWSIVSS